VELTKEELALLWQILNQVNIPGSVAEILVSLKAKVREELKKYDNH
jgi:hypothetical protein